MRNRGDSEQGPFQAKATVLTSPDHIRGLLDQMQADAHDNRQTQEMDPAIFRSLREQASEGSTSGEPEIELVEPVHVEPVHVEPEHVEPAHVEPAQTRVPVAKRPAVVGRRWYLYLIIVFAVTLLVLLALDPQ